MEIGQVLTSIGSAVAVYLFATMSPGPANLAILSAAMRWGRGAGLSVAAGVVTGSLLWGLVAAAGLSILIATHRGVTAMVMVLGGFYLAFLGYRAFRSFRRATRGAGTVPGASACSARTLYLQGFAIHLTNPKAVLAWSAIIAIVLVPGSVPFLPFLVVAGCWIMGIVVFCGYALLFSSHGMADWYAKHGRWVDLGSALLFALFAIQLVQRGLEMLSFEAA